MSHRLDKATGEDMEGRTQIARGVYSDDQGAFSSAYEGEQGRLHEKRMADFESVEAEKARIAAQRGGGGGGGGGGGMGMPGMGGGGGITANIDSADLASMSKDAVDVIKMFNKGKKKGAKK